MRIQILVRIMCASLLCIGGVSRAELVTIGPFPLEGAQVIIPVDTPGSGTGIVTLDSVTNLLSWNFTWSDLEGAPIALHFHGPAMPGQIARIRVDIGAISGLTSPSIGSTTISPDFVPEVLDGLWYMNIHTSEYVGGEVRGQVVTPPGCDGDANGDSVVDVNDISYVLFRLGDPCGAPGCAGDANSDGVVDVNDIRYVLIYLGNPCL